MPKEHGNYHVVNCSFGINNIAKVDCKQRNNAYK